MGNNALDLFIVQTYYGEPVEWDLVDEVDKGLPNGVHVAVVIHVFLVHIGDDRYGRRKGHERTITLIRLRHKDIPLPQFCIGSAPNIQSPPYDHGWIKVCAGQY